MRTPALVVGKPQAADGFFHTCHRISTTHYEGREGSGTMLVAAERHANVRLEMTLRSRIDLHDHRAVRKVLEMTGDGLAMVSDSAVLLGLGRMGDGYDRSSESVFEVIFGSHAAWTFGHAQAVLMSVADGSPRLPQGELDEDEFRRVLGAAFGEPSDLEYGRLWNVALEAARQRRGTILVVAREAAAEASRMGGQALALHPIALTPERVRLLTAIDGALLVDLAGRCHAAGVILDGRASRRGDPARGARFNSAVRYVDASESPCVALVISEGGSVDLVRPIGSP
jgi:hypothetical protein